MLSSIDDKFNDVIKAKFALSISTQILTETIFDISNFMWNNAQWTSKCGKNKIANGSEIAIGVICMEIERANLVFLTNKRATCHLNGRITVQNVTKENKGAP